MTNRYFFLCVVCFWGCMLEGCSKYSRMQPIGGDTYLRIFNTITNYDPRQLLTGTTQDIVAFRTLCILIDPTQDATGRFDGAASIGDFLGPRPLYSGPYETHPNDNVSRYNNTEWPGAYRVQTGGVINGLDLSRWARIAPGKHRVVVLRRMPTPVNRDAGKFFTELSPAGRDTTFRTAVDTTLELNEQSIYIIEIASSSLTDVFPLKMLLRKETLNKEDFSDSSAMYVNFYNYLETPATPAALDVYYQTEYVVNTTSPVPSLSGNAPRSWAAQDLATGELYSRVVTPERLLTRMTEKFATAAPYVKIPMPPADSFYYTQGLVLGQYRLPFDRPHTLLNFYLPGQSAATGATPWASLFCDEWDGQNIMDNFPSFLPVKILSTFYQTVTSPAGVSRAFPLVSTITLTTKYTNLNQASNDVIFYEASLQRPAPAELTH